MEEKLKCEVCGALVTRKSASQKILCQLPC